MRVLVFGGGAVGLGIGSCLLNAGEEVDIIAREATVRRLREEGLLRTGIFGDYVASPDRFGAYASLSELPGGAYDAIAVCVKSGDTRRAAKALGVWDGAAGQQPPVVLFQNGWGNFETATGFFPAERVYSARVITGFSRSEFNHVDVTVHADAIHIGHLQSRPEDVIIPLLCEAIALGGIPCEPTGTVAKDLWAKMLYNCALNPLGAVLQVPYGRLGESEHTRAVMDEIIREVFPTMRASGYSTHWDSPEAYLEVFYGYEVPATYRHESSMLQDIRAGRKTEVDALSGQVVSLARKAGIDVPRNETMYRVIKYLEEAE